MGQLDQMGSNFGQILAKLDRSTYFDYNPENSPRISRIATGTAIVSHKAYFRSLLGEMLQKTNFGPFKK